MKRKLLAVITIALLIMSFTGCSNESNMNNNGTSTPSTSGGIIDDAGDVIEDAGEDINDAGDRVSGEASSALNGIREDLSTNSMTNQAKARP